jgi:MOSC domain-containing protein YiiM
MTSRLKLNLWNRSRTPIIFVWTEQEHTMQLLSINVSPPVTVPYRGETLRTGIYKQPVTGPVRLTKLNLEGDGQADLQAHGGPDKAVYVYPHEHYAYWQQQLGRDDFAYGQFGENFTTIGLLEDQVFIGDVYRLGSALVQVSQPRVPCFKLAHKMGIPTFVKTFMASERTGFYLRVLAAGTVEAGDAWTREQVGPGEMSVQAVFHLLYFDQTNVAAAAQARQLEALAAGWRDSFAELVAKHA